MTGSRKEDPKDTKKPTPEEGKDSHANPDPGSDSDKQAKGAAGPAAPPTLSGMPDVVLRHLRDQLLKGTGGAKALSSLAQTSRGFSSLFAPDTKAQALKALFLTS